MLGKHLVTSKIKDVSFELKKGEILILVCGCGPHRNGDDFVGVDPLKSGQIILNGDSVRIKSPKDAISKGIG